MYLGNEVSAACGTRLEGGRRKGSLVWCCDVKEREREGQVRKKKRKCFDDGKTDLALGRYYLMHPGI